MKNLLIIGYGRFGQLFAEIARSEFNIQIRELDAGLQESARNQGFEIITVEDITSADVICLAVPISKMQDTIQSIKPFVRDHHLIMDVCSVKVYPADLMKTHFPQSQTLATHPLFGPDSAKAGLPGLKLVLCPLNTSDENLEYWKHFWEKRGVEVIITTPEKHDAESIFSQGFTYSIARIINNMHIPELTFTTKSYEAIKRVADLSANDSAQLFHDMLYYNPYFESMKVQFEQAFSETVKVLNEVVAEKQNRT